MKNRDWEPLIYKACVAVSIFLLCLGGWFVYVGAIAPILAPPAKIFAAPSPDLAEAIEHQRDLYFLNQNIEEHKDCPEAFH